MTELSIIYSMPATSSDLEKAVQHYTGQHQAQHRICAPVGADRAAYFSPQSERRCEQCVKSLAPALQRKISL